MAVLGRDCDVDRSDVGGIAWSVAAGVLNDLESVPGRWVVIVSYVRKEGILRGY